MDGGDVERSRLRGRLSRRDVMKVARRFIAWDCPQNGPSRKERYDGFDAPKGHKNLAQGFDPGLRSGLMRPESGARGGSLFRNEISCGSNRSNPIWCPFHPNPAVAACNSDKAHHSNTPVLHHAVRPDSSTSAKRLVRARLTTIPNSGLKPWAKLFCPFGACSDRWPRKQGHSRELSSDRWPRKRGHSRESSSDCWPRPALPDRSTCLPT